MDRPAGGIRYRRLMVHRLTEQIEDTAQITPSHRDSDRRTRVRCRQAAHQPVGRLHGDTAHRVLPDMLGGLSGHDPAVWGRDRDGIEQARQSVCGKTDVQHRPNDLDHGALVRLAHCKNPLDLVPPTAPEPAEISVISCVMALCRARL